VKRRAERLESHRKALSAEANKDSRAARKFFASACSITHDMRNELVSKCKELGISFIVALYEADAQMARLAHTGTVDVVITEDSDLLAYGCPRILFKIDLDSGREKKSSLCVTLPPTKVCPFDIDLMTCSFSCVSSQDVIIFMVLMALVSRRHISL